MTEDQEDPPNYGNERDYIDIRDPVHCCTVTLSHCCQSDNAAVRQCDHFLFGMSRGALVLSQELGL
jgi:hypothetical protein